MRIESARLRLRPTAAGDLPFVVDAEHAPENREFVVCWPRERHAAALGDPDLSHLICEDVAEQRPVGYVILAGLAPQSGNLELRRIVITDKGRGYGRETLALVMRLAFERLGVHRLWLDVMPANARALGLYRRAGFHEDGTLRECLRTDHGYESLVVMSMLPAEYARVSRGA